LERESRSEVSNNMAATVVMGHGYLESFESSPEGIGWLGKVEVLGKEVRR